MFKHALLAQLVLALEKKDKPFFCLDTHAGIAHYDLQHEWAQKNAEYKGGIELVWQRQDAPAELAPYLAAVRAENKDGKLRYYPGSPRIVRGLMRPRDRMVLTELNPRDCESLSTLFLRDRQVKVELIDGYQALKVFLPPPERRGLVFIDSSFDRGGEFARLTKGLVEAHGKFATGVYALWYPLMDAMSMRAFERRVVATGIRKILQLEISVQPEDSVLNMRGCGLIVANPPYGFEAAAQAIVAWLAPVLAQQRHVQRPVVRWLVPE